MPLFDNDKHGVSVCITSNSRKLTIDGKTDSYPVYRIKLDELRYNAQNDRIATRISEYAEEHDGSLPDETDAEQYNTLIENFIYESNKDKLNQTQTSIKEFGQQEPGVVTADGLVIDGNRRFTCLRRLAREDSKFSWFEASILPEELGKNREAIKCLELELQFAREERVGYDPIDRLVGIYRDLIDPESKIDTLTPEKYARSANIPLKKLEEYMEQANLMIEFLEFANASKRFSLARALKISGPLVELPALFKKCKDNEEIERVKQIAFANILADPEDIVRFLRKLKKIISSNARESFLNREDELAAKIVDRMGELSEVNTSTINEEIRSDLELKNEFKDAVEAANLERQREEALGSPMKLLEDAESTVSRIDPTIVAKLSDSDSKQMLQKIEALQKSLSEIASSIQCD